MTFDMKLIFEKGDVKLSDCKQFPTEADLRESGESMEEIGTGKLKRIIIDIKEIDTAKTPTE